MNPQKILIIKVGYSETLDPDISTFTSYGDVLRTTVLLHLYKNDHVTWLVDAKAYPVLKGNTYIDRILIYNLTSVLQLRAEYFDTVINMEKVPGISAMADEITAWRRYGFRFDVKSGNAEAYDGTHNILQLCKDIEKKRERGACWQEGLYEMVGETWNGEPYILGYQPKSKAVFDIGFNYNVGNKWPQKAWPEKYWKKLEELLSHEYTVSWQQGLNDMEDYFEWIHSCKLLITNDSFGLHLAIAMGIRVICLIGPTNYKETHLYGCGSFLMPEHLDCIEFPCKVEQCIHFSDTCMSAIQPERVHEKIRELLPK